MNGISIVDSIDATYNYTTPYYQWIRNPDGKSSNHYPLVISYTAIEAMATESSQSFIAW